VDEIIGKYGEVRCTTLLVLALTLIGAPLQVLTLIHEVPEKIRTVDDGQRMLKALEVLTVGGHGARD